MLFALRASSANALEKSLVVVGSINIFMGVRLELASQYFRIIICDVGEAPTLRIRGAKESFKTFVNSRDKFVNIPVDEEVRMFLSPKTAA